MAQEPLIVRPPHAPFDDGTITRAGKKAAMSGGIDLSQQRRSLRRHRASQAWVVSAGVLVLLVGIAVMVWRMLP